MELEEFYSEAWHQLAGKELKKPIGFTHKQILDLFEEFKTDEINELTTNRLVMGALRYNIRGLEVDPKYDLLGTMRLKLDLYTKDGNQEYLLDLINYCKLEIINQQHPKANFNPIDDGIHAVEYSNSRFVCNMPSIVNNPKCVFRTNRGMCINGNPNCDFQCLIDG